MWKGAVLVAIIGGATLYLAARLIDPHERLNLVFPIVWVIGIVLVAIGHSEPRQYQATGYSGIYGIGHMGQNRLLTVAAIIVIACMLLALGPFLTGFGIGFVQGVAEALHR